jgi:hypothetical protein
MFGLNHTANTWRASSNLRWAGKSTGGFAAAGSIFSRSCLTWVFAGGKLSVVALSFLYRLARGMIEHVTG